jgi:hypothetical protein
MDRPEWGLLWDASEGIERYEPVDHSIVLTQSQDRLLREEVILDPDAVGRIRDYIAQACDPE